MGCFLGCFGSSKDSRRRRNQRHKVLAQPRLQVNSGSSTPFSGVVIQDYPEKPSCPVEQVLVKPEEEPQQSPNARKKVTFDANVKTYEHVLLNEEDKKEEEVKEKEKFAKPSQSESSCDHSSITSSSSSYPPNHRYQNCRESDDELDYEESDIDDEDGELDDEFDDADLDDEIMESRARIFGAQVIGDEVNQLIT